MGLGNKFRALPLVFPFYFAMIYKGRISLYMKLSFMVSSGSGGFDPQLRNCDTEYIDCGLLKLNVKWGGTLIINGFHCIFGKDSDSSFGKSMMKIYEGNISVRGTSYNATNLIKQMKDDKK